MRLHPALARKDTDHRRRIEKTVKMPWGSCNLPGDNTRQRGTPWHCRVCDRTVLSNRRYPLRTLIKPVDDNDEYDADIQIVMNPNPQWEPKDYIHAIYRALKQNQNYADKLRLKTRCVTIDYGGDFHLDVVPRVTSGGRHYVCNRIENRPEPTDGTGYRDWFNDKNRITGGNLNRVVRILKYLRDHKNNHIAKSVLLTTRNCSVSPPPGRGRVREGVVPSSRFPSSNYAAARRGAPFLTFPPAGGKGHQQF